MRKISTQWLLISLFVSSFYALAQKPAQTPTWTDHKLALEEYPNYQYQGEYLKGNSGLQVVVVQNKFYVSEYTGGLLGAGWDHSKISHQWLTLEELKRYLANAVKHDRGIKVGDYPAPKNAEILFAGQKNDKWKFNKIVNNVMMAGARTAKDYQDFTLHLEFSTPFKPERPLSHPDKGNSGIYLLGLYEVQIEDSFGLDMAPSAWQNMEQIKAPESWAGALYRVKPADINMSLAPLVWQSFDITFTAAKFNNNQKIHNATISVWHNGVKIHDNIELSKGTGSKAKLSEVTSGPILFQNHHNPVQFRNIWLVKH
ncbi:DUF1080 domain-containing protein [Paraglaciecola aquimarina]|uniref:DUF1080 domain-containing protein n=1 Tax=Paraglaciecola aquimarina TaxID=1235557 RepID=A0ABU3SXN6_9ALTE|nr:DUF1080 domain-containing protein [Paraglaciecola aquimarina]MDU0354780.1 DUF1080 domain-containing protein [Paraglaciecola aquimarina]